MQTDSWNKWGSYSQPSSNTSMGGSGLMYSSADDMYLDTIPEVDSIKSKRSSSSTMLQDPLGYRAMPAAVHRIQQREPVWAHSSPAIPEWQHADDSRRQSYVDISPPSTPRKSWAEHDHDEMPVSPIEPIPPLPFRVPLPEARKQSQIPRRAAPQITRKAVPVTKKKEPTKWDPYSGEVTSSARGVASSIRPGTGIQPLEEQFPQLKERTKQILADLRKRGQVRRAFESATPDSPDDDPVESPVHREPWKGASGRTALVDPVQDTPSARTGPLQRVQQNIPSIDTQNLDRHRNYQPVYTQQVSETPQTAYTTQTMAESQAILPNIPEASAPSLNRIPSQESIKPVVPLRIAPKSRTPSPSSISTVQSRSITYPQPEHTRIELTPDLRPRSPPRSAEPKMLQSPFRSPQLPKYLEEPAPLSSTRTESPLHEPSPRTPSPPSYPEYEPVSEPATHDMEPEISRFSWTTYATSVTDSPHSSSHAARLESPPPPMPEVPAIHKRPAPAAMRFSESLYMDAEAARSQGSIVIRKPVPVPTATVATSPAARSKSGDETGTLSTSKTLPQLPPEMEAADKVSGLEARLEAMGRRKHNISRIVKELRATLEKNRVNYDMYKRREVEAEISEYSKEMQGLTNEEYEISLKLHRAVKKRDREDGYELPTGLWIRRVTS